MRRSSTGNHSDVSMSPDDRNAVDRLDNWQYGTSILQENDTFLFHSLGNFETFLDIDQQLSQPQAHVLKDTFHSPFGPPGLLGDLGDLVGPPVLARGRRVPGAVDPPLPLRVSMPIAFSVAKCH